MKAVKKDSAGLLMHRCRGGVLEVLLVHPGGPWWANKDLGAWTIPKGQIEAGEDPLQAAKREFQEELGMVPASEVFVPLGTVTQKAGKVVHAWAFAGDCETSECRSNIIQIEWPPRSGKRMSIPEIDRAEFYSLTFAYEKILPAQREFLDRLIQIVRLQQSGAE